MSRKFYKYRLLLDENFPDRHRLPRLNHRFNLKHLVSDLQMTGISDEKVFEVGQKQKRIIVTFNDKDFFGIATKSKNTGVIGVSAQLSIDQIDKKLTAFLIKQTPKLLYGQFHYISGET